MRVSISLTDYTWPDSPAGIAANLRDVVRAADAAGVDTVWVADHLLQADPNSQPGAEMLEAYTVLGYLAGVSERVRLGTLVSAATYRAPAMLIKAVTTVDVLSHGRAWLGIGAGYLEDEAAAYELSLPPIGERFQTLEDTVRLALQMWSGDASAFAGARHRLARPVGNPRPLAVPHPPLLIGGTGERSTLRLAARYADACNLFDIPDGGRTIRHKLAVLAGHCSAAGRAYASIEKTVSSRWPADERRDDFLRRCGELAAMGIGHVILLAAGAWTPAAVAALAPAISALEPLDPSPGTPTS